MIDKIPSIKTNENTKKTLKIFEVRVDKTNFSDKINSPVSSRDDGDARDDADQMSLEKLSLLLYLQHIEIFLASRVKMILC